MLVLFPDPHPLQRKRVWRLWEKSLVQLTTYEEFLCPKLAKPGKQPKVNRHFSLIEKVGAVNLTMYVHAHTPNNTHTHFHVGTHIKYTKSFEGSTKIHLLLQFDQCTCRYAVEFTHAEHEHTQLENISKVEQKHAQTLSHLDHSPAITRSSYFILE